MLNRILANLKNTAEISVRNWHFVAFEIVDKLESTDGGYGFVAEKSLLVIKYSCH
jgi:hypothetical protein